MIRTRIRRMGKSISEDQIEQEAIAITITPGKTTILAEMSMMRSQTKIKRELSQTETLFIFMLGVVIFLGISKFQPTPIDEFKQQQAIMDDYAKRNFISFSNVQPNSSTKRTKARRVEC